MDQKLAHYLIHGQLHGVLAIWYHWGFQHVICLSRNCEVQYGINERFGFEHVFRKFELCGVLVGLYFLTKVHVFCLISLRL